MGILGLGLKLKNTLKAKKKSTFIKDKSLLRAFCGTSFVVYQSLDFSLRQHFWYKRHSNI